MPRYAYQGVAQDQNGKHVLSATVTPYLAGTTTAVTVYAASSGGSSVNSVSSDSTNGTFIMYFDVSEYDTYQAFDVVISKTDFTSVTYSNIYPFPHIIYDEAAGKLVIAISTIGRFNWDGNTYEGYASGGPALFNLASTSIVPNVVPNKSDQNTGLGAVAADTPAIIGGGVPLQVFGTTVEISNAEIKLLASPAKELVPAQGAGTLIELVSAVLILNYSGGVLAEPGAPDDLAIEYDDGTGSQIQTFNTTGFIEAGTDAIIILSPGLTQGSGDAAWDPADVVNKNIALINTGTNYTGAGSTSTMTVKVTYRVHALGL